MFENKDKCIANCMMTPRETMPLYRSFGMYAVDSNMIRFIRRDLQEQISAFYPDVSMQDIKITSTTDEIERGQFNINVSLGD